MCTTEKSKEAFVIGERHHLETEKVQVVWSTTEESKEAFIIGERHHLETPKGFRLWGLLQSKTRFRLRTVETRKVHVENHRQTLQIENYRHNEGLS